MKKIAIVGNPNVGKSVMFNNLTGVYVVVSNYPGTSVEVARGRCRIGKDEFEIVDTPGMYSILPITEEEHVARNILLLEKPDIVMHMIDAKNLERMLPFTLQLIEAGLPVLLVLNMMDELEKTGKELNVEKLEKILNIPVVPTICTSEEGMMILKERISVFVKEGKLCRKKEQKPIKYETSVVFSIEMALEQICSLLKDGYFLSKRATGLLLMQDDKETIDNLRKNDNENFNKVNKLIEKLKKNYSDPLSYLIAVCRQQQANNIVSKVVRKVKDKKKSFQQTLSFITMNPISGIILLMLVLYWGFYKFVGDFGAGVLVDYLEGFIFEKHINPSITKFITSFIPWQIIQNLFIGEYGIFTLGIRYAIAIILPIVTTFFLAFSVIEDSGYLPRLAMLIDKIFKRIGLSGRAVIPMVLGFGCTTMATMVTRTLPTKRERIIATMLLALAVPCAAQFGVILALLEGRKWAMFIWAGVIAIVFLFIGYLSSKILHGERPAFYMEIPPLRFPKISNILMKTSSRVKWYIKEVIPLFMIASLTIYIGNITKIFDFCIIMLKKPVELVGLPVETAKIFLFGFFRRDYGAAGLYDLNKEGLLSGVQLTVACIALTLFLPCIAQFMMNIKERGIKTALGISGFVFLFSFSVAFIVNYLLIRLGIVL